MPATPAEWKPITQVNSTTLGQQYNTQVLSLPDGGYLVIWTDRSHTFNTNGDAILGQRFNSEGAKVGTEVKLSVGFNNYDQIEAQATLLSNGQIAITFVNSIPSGDYQDLFVERFNSTNLKFLGRTGIEEQSGTDADMPTITALANGAYLVAYRSFTHTSDSGVVPAESDVVAKIVSANGTVSGPFTLYHSSGKNGLIPDAATLSNGDTIVVYEPRGTTDDSSDVAFTILHANGNATTGTLGGKSGVREWIPEVAALKNGGFVAVWSDDTGDGTGNPGIRAEVRTNAGGIVKASFQVNVGYTLGVQQQAAVVALKDGGFIVSWSDFQADAILGQRFDANGTAVGSVYFVTGTDTPFEVNTKDMALLKDGRIAYAFSDLEVYHSIFDTRDNVQRGTGHNDSRLVLGAGGDVHGMQGNDRLVGGSGEDRLYGDSGNDTLLGNSGSDELFGGGGNDHLRGGLDGDILHGGRGADVFIFNSAGESPHDLPIDTIADFKHGQHDRIDLHKIDADTLDNPGNDKFKFIGSHDFHAGRGGELRFEGGLLQADVNGDGEPDFEIYLNVGKLVAADFIL